MSQTQTSPVPELIERVMEVFTELIKNDTPFTILDVSERVKNDGGPFVRHRDVHEIAKPIFNSLINEEVIGEWTYCEIEVDTVNGPAFARLYHPEGFNPDNYTQRSKTASKPASQVGTKPYSATPVTSQTPTGFPNSHLDVPAKIRSDGAIEIPLNVITASGLLDSVAFIHSHPNSITISLQQSGPATLINKGFRIRKTALQNANLTKNVHYAVFTDKIVIYQA